MRQIKFRYYSDRENKCFPVEAIDFGTGPHKATVRFRIDGAAYQEDLDLNKLSEFTGLHDHDGKEIWEGDVVCVASYIPTSSGKFEDATLVVTFNEGGYRLPDNYSPDDQILHDLGITGALEKVFVIGNIYETPSLIQGETE